jgi:hypothetical protein
MRDLFGSTTDRRTGLATAPVAAIPVVAAFYLSVLTAPSHHLTLLLTGTVGIVIAWLLAGRRGVDTAAGREMLLVFVLAMSVTVFPMAAQAPMPVHTMVATGLCIVAIEASWAVRRYPVLPPRRHYGVPGVALAGIVGLAFGILFALGLALFATLVMGVAFVFSAAIRAEILALAPSIYAGYLFGGAAAGLVVGLLWPLGRWPVGVMLIGVIAAMFLYGAMGYLVDVARGEFQSILDVSGIALACGMLVGPPLALMLQYDAHTAEALTPIESRAQAVTQVTPVPRLPG